MEVMKESRRFVMKARGYPILIITSHGFLLLFFRAEIKHLRELLQREKEDREKCEGRCEQHRKNIWTKIND